MNLPDFKDKTITFLVKNDDLDHDLINPYFEEQGDRLFIVGTVPKENSLSGWTEGKVKAVAWDFVTNYTVWDSYEDYKIANQMVKDYDKNNS